MIELAEPQMGSVRVKVVGVGNAGGMIVKRVARERVPGIECAAVNTAVKDLGNYAEVRRLQIGATLTRGHGAGMDPQVGRKAALEDANRIRDFLGENDIVFLVAGFGKGTGTGATPVLAELAREQGALTIALITQPANFEGRRHRQIAEDGLKELKERVDAFVPLPNQRPFALPAIQTIDQVYAYMDETVLGAVRGLVEVILRGGRHSYDLADLRAMFKGAGLSAFSLGAGKGEGRVGEVTRGLAEYPFVQAGQLSSARSLLVSLATGPDFTHRELEELMGEVEQLIGGEPDRAPALFQDEALTGEARVMLFAAGLHAVEAPRPEFELFTGRETGSRGGAPLYRPVTLSGRSGRASAEPESGAVRDDDLDVPAFMRRPRNGPMNGPRG